MLTSVENTVRIGKSVLAKNHPEVDVRLGYILRKLGPNNSEFQTTENESNYFYLGSIAKVFWFFKATQLLESKTSGLNPSEQFDTDLLDWDINYGSPLYRALKHAKESKDQTDVDPLLKLPKVTHVFGPDWINDLQSGNKNNKAIRVVTDYLEEAERKKIANEILPLAPVIAEHWTMSDLAYAALGPSSNIAVELIKTWLASENQLNKPAELVQDYVDNMVGHGNIFIRGSSKANLGPGHDNENVGRLDKVLEIFRAIFDHNTEKLGISDENLSRIAGYMNETGNPHLEPHALLKDQGKSVESSVGKAGWDGEYDADDVAKITPNGPDHPILSTAACIERATLSDGTIADWAYFVYALTRKPLTVDEIINYQSPIINSLLTVLTDR